LRRATRFSVIAGLDPAIHSIAASFFLERNGMDARIKSGHDEGVACGKRL
jgi:hypothetical protein